MRPDNRFVLCVTFYERDPGGTLIAQRGNSRAKTEAVANPFQYTAGYLDTNTGLYKLGARYYDPTTLGRFTQQDPSGQETNLYAYTGDDPVSNTDPSGLFQVYLNLQDSTGVEIGVTGALGIASALLGGGVAATVTVIALSTIFG